MKCSCHPRGHAGDGDNDAGSCWDLQGHTRTYIDIQGHTTTYKDTQGQEHTRTYMDIQGVWINNRYDGDYEGQVWGDYK